jgi:hypothetical protein
MTDLKIPLGILDSFRKNNAWTAARVRALTAPIVVAELDRLAEQLKNEWDPHTIWIALHRRARELDKDTS